MKNPKTSSPSFLPHPMLQKWLLQNSLKFFSLPCTRPKHKNAYLTRTYSMQILSTSMVRSGQLYLVFYAQSTSMVRSGQLYLVFYAQSTSMVRSGQLYLVFYAQSTSMVRSGQFYLVFYAQSTSMVRSGQLNSRAWANYVFYRWLNTRLLVFPQICILLTEEAWVFWKRWTGWMPCIRWWEEVEGYEWL